MAIGPEANQRQKILLVVFIIIFLLAASVLSRRFLGTPQGEFFFPSFPIVVEEKIVTIPFDLFESDSFLDLQEYEPIVAPEPARRENPFE